MHAWFLTLLYCLIGFGRLSIYYETLEYNQYWVLPLSISCTNVDSFKMSSALFVISEAEFRALEDTSRDFSFITPSWTLPRFAAYSFSNSLQNSGLSEYLWQFDAYLDNLLDAFFDSTILSKLSLIWLRACSGLTPEMFSARIESTNLLGLVHEETGLYYYDWC